MGYIYGNNGGGDPGGTVSTNGVAAPEPGTLSLLGMGLMTGAGMLSPSREMVGTIRRRKAAAFHAGVKEQAA